MTVVLYFGLIGLLFYLPHTNLSLVELIPMSNYETATAKGVFESRQSRENHEYSAAMLALDPTWLVP